ncbi:hypothetical protein AU255_04950 [Methyloprofundus sedimenti]|uniref:Uncharacterized protein n=1 Tax=Methyloprofundus sedimenti TaxID=1420851 RepID=A0A1V8M6S5_9GAMM|nr:hypothetical protein [Methyloprofundus sedimenti]OQK17242.1 hypothetical protein AU255_04950 [Methyloprofundus sedimenti]
MNKLFELKDWLTLEDTAKELSQALSEPVNKADILHLAIDGKITLSVNLLKTIPVNFGKIIVLNDAEREETPLENIEEGDIYSLENEWIFMETTQDIERIKGVWDLPMGDCNKQYIEFQLQKLNENIGGEKEFIPEDTSGLFLVSSNKEMVKVLIGIEDIEIMSGSIANGKKLRQRIKDEKFSEWQANELLKKYSEDRRRFIERSSKTPIYQTYYHDYQLRDSSFLVVRPRAISDFINTLDSEVLPEEKNVTVNDLFTNPPQNHSEPFEALKKQACNFINEYHRLPKNKKELWDYLTDQLEYDTRKNAILYPYSKKWTDFDAFSSMYKNRTTIR